MNDTNPEKLSRRKAYLFPAIIIGLLVMQIGLCLIGIYYATRSNANVVESDYYDKALHWDQQVATEQASAALGWTAKMNISAVPDMQANRTFVLEMKDRDGRPITGAKIRMIYFHHANARHVEQTELRDLSNGFYSATIAAARPGLWEFRLVAERGKEKFVRREQMNAGETGK